MADTRLRALEREARESGSPVTLQRLIAEHVRLGRGRHADVAEQLRALEAFEFPGLRFELFKAGGCFLPELGVGSASDADDVYALFDDYMQAFPVQREAENS